MQNWAGNVTYSASEVARPGSMTELAAAITSGPRVRALGSRHSFSTIADAATILDTTGLPEFLELSADRDAVTVNGSMTYGRLVELLAPFRFALHNLASLPHISIAGAIATGTHGSGDRNGNLATAVRALQIMTPDAEVLSLDRSDPDFAGAVVSLGALGVVTAVTLEIEPAFDVEQTVYDGPDLAAVGESFDDIFSSAYSVSAFTMWQGKAEQLWVKHRVGDESKPLSFVEATEKRHPILGIDAQACTDQFGVPGAWADRLPHFKMEFTPSAGEEIQSEFFVDRNDAAAAIAAIDAVGAEIADALLISELRTVARDDLWMSPHVGRDSLAIHFTWVPDQSLAEAAASTVANAIGHLSPRAHWGKVFDPSQFDLRQFDRLSDFTSLVERVDPRGRFQNDWYATVLER